MAPVKVPFFYHDTKKHQRYYDNVAITEAKKLVASVREQNNFPANIQCGEDLRVMPVYETEYETQPVYSLYAFAKSMTNVTIERVAQEYEHLDAYYIEYSSEEENESQPSITSSRIVVSRHNYCWSRFYLCKELMHCFIHETGEDGDSSATDTSNKLSKLIQELLIPTSNNSRQTLADNAAYYGAWEYMMPEDTLPTLASAYNKLSNEVGSDSAYGEIARFIRVPELLVKFKLDTYMGKFNPNTEGAA